jgi:aerobic carbon-monoxide dehydrogenase medium subunit
VGLQVPAPFEYERATSVDDAIATLQRLGPEARLIAGGHSLLPMMKLRLAAPEFLVDINDLRELDYIEAEGDELRIGAMTRHRALLESELVGRLAPIFHDAERVIADPVVRNRGTIGGALCQADPSEDLWAVCAAMKAQAAIRGPSGGRALSMPEFHRGPFETAVGDGEMLVEVSVPLRPHHGSAYEKLERRAGDWAIAAAGAALWLDGDHRIESAGIALSAVGAPVTCADAEQSLHGAAPSEEAFERAARLAVEACSPADDQRGDAEYKRHVAGELTRRALRRSAERALRQEV